MKKTLITLAALAVASVAQADVTLDDAAIHVVSPAQGASSTGTAISVDKAYTLSLSINWENGLDFFGDWSNKATVVQVGSLSNGWWSSQLRMFENGTSLQVGIRIDKDGWKDLHTDNGNVTVTGDTGLALGGGNITFDKATYCVDGLLILTWTFDGTDTYTLSALKNDGTLSTATLVATEGTLWDSIGEEYGQVTFPAVTGVVNEAVAFTGVLSEEDIITVSKAIPEPTTATLSLLALAGLAARRRRK